MVTRENQQTEVIKRLEPRKRGEPTDAPNPAIAPSFQVERLWRRGGDPDRSL